MNTTNTTQFDPIKGARLLEDAARWLQKHDAEPETAFADAKEQMRTAISGLPASVVVPYEKTAEGERAAQFRRICDERFLSAIDFTLVRCPAAFNRVAKWDGRAPGPAAAGATGLGKTFASWRALERLYVKENRAFAWFPVRRLVTELERYEKKECADDFFRIYDLYPILFVDDLDKINWDFESHAQMLFSFFDWVYRKKKPCIVTTNRDRAWWIAKAGDAFVRRLFDEACTGVDFR